MKRFLIKAAIAAAIVLSMVLLNAWIDPYNIFHVKEPRANGIEPNRNYLKTKYIIEHPNKYDSFIVGASRIGYMDVNKMENGNYYNMTYSGGTMYEFLQTLKTFLDKGVHIKHIVLEVDESSCKPRNFHDNLGSQRPYPVKNKLDFYKMYLFNPMTTIQALPLIKENQNTENAKALVANLYTTGCSENMKTKLTKETQIFQEMNYEPVLTKENEQIIEDTISDLKEYIRICNENKIELTIFTSLHHKNTYGDAIKSYGYLEFLRQLSETTSFYNFSGLNDRAVDYDNFYEWSHFTYEISCEMLDIIFQGKKDSKLLEQGYGMYVTKENKEEYINLLEKQLKEKWYKDVE